MGKLKLLQDEEQKFVTKWSHLPALLLAISVGICSAWWPLSSERLSSSVARSDKYSFAEYSNVLYLDSELTAYLSSLLLLKCLSSVTFHNLWIDPRHNGGLLAENYYFPAKISCHGKCFNIHASVYV